MSRNHRLSAATRSEFFAVNLPFCRLVSLFLLFSLSAGVYAMVPRPAYFDRGSEIVLPAGYNRRNAYPVFIVLPPTGIEAARVSSRMGLDPDRQQEFILVFPVSRSTREEYLPNFATFIEWYEERILQDLAFLLENHSADADRVYVGGYSLGGDLSWALSVRNPHVFAGAVMAGTRASYPASNDALERLRQRGFRGSFLIGDREDPARYQGINFARSRFESANVVHRYREYSGGHVMPAIHIFQSEIRYVTEVGELPEPVMPTTMVRTSPGPFSHTSRDRFAVRVGIPAEFSSDGLTVPRQTEASFRAEWPWDQYYLRTVASLTGSDRTTDSREHRLRQEVVFGMGSDAGFWGAGLGWDWVRQFADGNAYGELDLLFMRADRNPWLIPAGTADPERVDSLLVVRYTVPRGIGAGVRPEQLFNLRIEYLLRIADIVVVDAGLGSYTVQNQPVAGLSSLSDALDHRLQWEMGLGLRAPSPLLWRIGHRGIASRAIEESGFDYRGVWSVSIEYSF